MCTEQKTGQHQNQQNSARAHQSNFQTSIILSCYSTVHYRFSLVFNLVSKDGSSIRGTNSSFPISSIRGSNSSNRIDFQSKPRLSWQRHIVGTGKKICSKDGHWKTQDNIRGKFLAPSTYFLFPPFQDKKRWHCMFVRYCCKSICEPLSGERDAMRRQFSSSW